MPTSDSPLPDNAETRVTITSWEDAIRLYGSEWCKLVADNRLNPTHLPGWLDISLRSHRPSAQAFVLVVTASHTLLAILPFLIQEKRFMGMKVAVAELLTNFVSYHANFMTKMRLCDFFRVALKNTANWDIFRFANFLCDDQAVSELKAYADEHHLAIETLSGERSPFLTIHSEWEAYIPLKNKKFRYKLRWRDRTLRDNPKLTLRSEDSVPDTSTLLEEILRIERRSWKATHSLDIASRPAERRYYSMLLPFLQEQNALHVDMLYHDTLPIAYSLCVRWNGWFGQLKTSFDTDHASLSPGAMVIDSSLRSAFAYRACEFDFLGDMDVHKLAWTDQYRDHVDLFLYDSSNKAKFIHLAKQLKSRIMSHERQPTVKPIDTRE